MANLKSQKKRNLQNEKRHARNKAARSELKTRIKNVETAAASGGETAGLLGVAYRRIDQIAAKGVIHRNAANRKKSRLAKRAARLAAGESQ